MINKRLEKRILTYSLTSAAMLTSASNLNASVQITGTPNHTINNSGTYLIDFDGDTNNDVKLQLFDYGSYGAAFAFGPVSNGSLVGYVKPAGFLNRAYAFTTAQSIPFTASNWKTAAKSFAPNFNGAGDKYIALKFDIGGNTHIGFIKINLDALQTTLVIKEYGYQDVAGADVPAGSLPVELSNFTAQLVDNSVKLKWSTATEVNNHGFDVERSSGNESWEKIGFVAGHGNSNSPKQYTFTDHPTGGTSFSYRLKQVDNDGKYKYYDAITVKLDSPDQPQLLQNSPNPFNPSTAIKFYIPNNSDVNIKVYDMLGKEVTTLISKQVAAGHHIVFWNGRDRFGNEAASGVYIYRLTAGSFTETKKMNLLK